MNQHNKNTSPCVGYVLKRYPRFSETFVVNEILSHERAGLAIDIFALGPVEETHFQDSISRVRAPVTRFNDKQRSVESFWRLYQQAQKILPDFSARIGAVIVHHNVHEVAQAIMLAIAVHERGIQHLHAHFGTKATTVTRMAAQLSGVTYSFTAHAKDIYYPYQESTDMAGKLQDAAKAITISDYNLAYLQVQYPLVAGNITRIYNGLDLTLFPYQKPEHRPRHILAVGRLVAKKGFNILINALHILKQRGEDFHCTLIGDGAEREALSQYIHEKNISDRITLTGLRPQADIITAMQNAAMVVAPCVVSDEGDRDGLPTVLLESMALGTAVISTQVAGIPELVTNEETGLCIPSGDPVSLANAIQRLLNDSALQLFFSTQARKRIEQHYDIDRNTALLRDVFITAMERNGLIVNNTGPGGAV